MEFAANSESEVRVHLLCGLNGAGKTTYARRLNAVRFSLDEWMLRLYPHRYDDPEYAPLAENCKDLIWDVALQVLALDRSVVLDWNQWNRQRRAQWLIRAAEAGYPAVLHYLDVSPETAITRSSARDSDTSHRLAADDIRHMATIFEPPSPDEGLQIVRVSP